MPKLPTVDEDTMPLLRMVVERLLSGCSASIITALIVGFNCLLASNVNAQDANKQTEMAGVKLGTRVDSLGLKLDDYRSAYRYKGKYILSGYFSEVGHPIFKIELWCKDANASDQQSGIKCNDKSDEIIKKFGNKVEALCSAVEAYDWASQSMPEYYYNANTNQFWRINPDDKKVISFGIADKNGGWRNCIKPLSDNDIRSIRLGMDAKNALKENFISPHLQMAFANDYVTVAYDDKKDGYPITSFWYSCFTEDGKRTGAPIASCGTSAVALKRKYGSEISERCLKNFDEFSGFYNKKTKEFWSYDTIKKRIDGYGFAESPQFEDCNDIPRHMTSQVRLILESANRKVNEPPLPLRGNKGVLKIRGVTLGDGVSSCPNIQSEISSTERKIENICVVKDGDNITLVYFDIKNKGVVKVYRVAYVNDIKPYLDDALNFYGRNEFKRNIDEKAFLGAVEEIYEYGDTENSRGLKISISKCSYFDGRRTVNICPVEANYIVTFLMVDADAFKEAQADGHEAFKKKEF